MIETLSKTMSKWVKSTDPRRKLQHVYLFLAAIVLITAGLVSLINPDLGRNILKLSGLALVIYLANAVTWHLINSFLVSRTEIVQKQPALKQKMKKL